MALRFLATLALAMLAACAAPNAPETRAMGAAPACDLSIFIDHSYRCPVQHVAPDQGPQLISNGTRLHD
jgi:hypothetical protein